jgi:hypothetical protein
LKFNIPNDLYVHLQKAISLPTMKARTLYLNNLGFHHVIISGTSGAEVWRNDALKLIVKNAFLYCDNDPPTKVKCPTIYFGGESACFYRQWLCQPVVNRQRRALALEAITACLHNPSKYDLHVGNVGHLDVKGKKVPVLFDW